MACARMMWRPGLGDPSIGGLVLTGLYALVSLLFLYVSLTPRRWAPGERLLWGAATVVILAISLNKQLDLQQFINLTGRCWARANGLADQRILLQRGFGLAVVALGAGLAVWVARRAWPALGANRPLLWSLGLMAAFVVLEIARFQHFLDPISETIERWRLHRMLEGVALLALLAAGGLRLRR